ncbi:MAG TPA: SDR family oxidoreductase [Stellaceae bacterium]|nr:SDR family oxidoreductase [Stellaceae bacterium]
MGLDERFTGRTVIVTGAATGIGAAIARGFAAAGAWVCGIDVDGPRLDGLVASLPHPGHAFTGDITDETAMRTVAGRVLDLRGGIDVVVNNAGIAGPQSPVDQTSLEDWNRTLAVNLTGTFLLCKHTLPALRRSRGAIVNIASALALIGWPNECAYGPTKAAIVQLTKGMAVDYAPDVRVNCVCPGAVRTEMIESVVSKDIDLETALAEYGQVHPLHRRLAWPREIAAAVMFLASDDASLITGAALPVDGGFSIAGRGRGRVE